MINALDQTGLAYFWSKITGRLATKADLVNGKVPTSQLPASGGGGFEPTIIPCTLDMADATESESSMSWATQLPTGSCALAIAAAEAGTPAILKVAMQSTTTDESSGESVVDSEGVANVMLTQTGGDGDITGYLMLGSGWLLYAHIESDESMDFTITSSESSAPSDYEINISCTAPELLSGSYTTSLASGTYTDAMSAAQNDHGVMATLNIGNGAMFGKVPMYLMQPPQDDGEGGYTTGYGYGSTTIRAPLNGSEQVFNVAVKIDSNDTATITTTNMSASGGGLPPVTTADAGKFLQVDSTGAWAAVAIPNASGVSF